MGFLYSYLTRVPCASPLRSVRKKINSPVCFTFTSTHERRVIHQRHMRHLRRIPARGWQAVCAPCAVQWSLSASFPPHCVCLSGLSYDKRRKRWPFMDTADSEQCRHIHTFTHTMCESHTHTHTLSAQLGEMKMLWWELWSQGVMLSESRDAVLNFVYCRLHSLYIDI